METWLDTKTKELLQHVPPEKLAPAGVFTFALVLLAAGAEWARVLPALQWVCRCGEAEARALLQRPLPTVVVTGLSLEDALIGQFELVSCDCVSVFLDDEVVRDGDPEYLRDLYAQVRESSEFEEVTLEIRSVPPTAEGARFVRQFLGLGPEAADWPAFPRRERMMRKKARIMLHWARKTGADVAMADG